MKTPTALLFAALIACASAHEGHDHDHDEEPPVAVNSDVVVLTKDTFTEFAAKPLSLIEFYAPWCGHCKALAPEYELAATELKGDVPIAKVDCTVEADVCAEQGVQGYPTLKVFKKGSSSDYKGARKSDSIVSYMKKQALPAVSVLDADKVDAFSTSDKVVVIGFFKNQKSDAYKAFAAVADKLRDEFVFGYPSDKDAAKKYGATQPDVVLFKSFDEGKADFDGEVTEEALTNFVKVNSVPLMDEIGPENYSAYVDAGLPIAYLFTSSPTEKESTGDAVKPFAKSYKGKLSFVYIDAVKYGGHGKNLNLKEQWPAFVIQDTKSGLRYIYPQDKEIKEADIGKFLEEYTAGKIEPTLKSEPIPEKNDESVKVVVGKSYEAIVLDKKKDVLIEFYAPWCGHSRSLLRSSMSLATSSRTLRVLLSPRWTPLRTTSPPELPSRLRASQP